MKSPKTKKCKVCKKPFEQFNSIQTWCSPACGYELSKKKEAKTKATEEKAERKKWAKRKEAIKPRSEHLSEAQTAFNNWVRYRDADLPCINTGQYVSYSGNDSDAAHYVSRSANKAMRFDLRNVHKSTKASNSNQEKWIHDYRINLINKLGEERFAQFEADCTYWRTHKRTFNIEYLKRIKAIFRKKLRVITKIRNKA